MNLQNILKRSKINMHSKTYTFDNFVVESLNNGLAHAVAIAIIDKPLSYNPVFLYGAWRSGKTHLLHTISNSMQEKRKDIKTLYIQRLS